MLVIHKQLPLLLFTVLEVGKKKYRHGPIPLTSRSPLPPLPSVLPSSSPNQLGGLQEHCKLPQQGLGWNHSNKRICVIFLAQKTHLVTTKPFLCGKIFL